MASRNHEHRQSTEVSVFQVRLRTYLHNYMTNFFQNNLYGAGSFYLTICNYFFIQNMRLPGISFALLSI
ncbi:hypothetical protein D1AOALGA4SA_8655 [Olavius algarvensis Delta 1 endosymbiont]|nr:hypothetical protein D1AOALGA4SA_8655 [Olavius algarvensis Delta 1 endosymbiont]